jgi:hypothetical protein
MRVGARAAPERDFFSAPPSGGEGSAVNRAAVVSVQPQELRHAGRKHGRCRADNGSGCRRGHYLGRVCDRHCQQSGGNGGEAGGRQHTATYPPAGRRIPELCYIPMRPRDQRVPIPSGGVLGQVLFDLADELRDG